MKKRLFLQTKVHLMKFYLIAGFFLVQLLLPIQQVLASSYDSKPLSKMRHQNKEVEITPIKDEIFFNAKFELDKTSKKFKVAGSTNLPDDYKMIVSIRRRESGWSDAPLDIHIKNGYFYSDPLIGAQYRWKSSKEILQKHKLAPSDLSPGFYRLCFMGMGASSQPKSVQKIIGRRGEFLKGDLIYNLLDEDMFKNCQDCGDYSVYFTTKIKLDGEESTEADNRVGGETMARLIVLMEHAKTPPYLKMEQSSKLNEIRLCKQDKLPGICFASMKHRWDMEGCQEQYGIYKTESHLDCHSENEGCKIIYSKGYNKYPNEKKLQKCLNDL